VLPLPDQLSRLVALKGRANRSLVFDRGADFYAADWSKIPAEGKQEFLKGFKTEFAPPGDFPPFVGRRSQALAAAGARSVQLYTQTRLVLGLGLPHPTETALLFDRLTGCPYIPGSSIKGLLREAARLVVAGELETDNSADGAFWQENDGANLDRLFGPTADSEVRAKGELVVYDAFPDEWPSLGLDVLTPHYQEYYGEDPESTKSPTVPPADWHDPVPVTFLAVQPGTRFTFWLGHRDRERRDDELPRVERLLVTALDWLGIGGKTSSGYGLFGREMPQLEPKRHEVTGGGRAETERKTEQPPPDPPPRSNVQEVLWKAATLELFQGKPTIYHGKQKAVAMKGGLGAKLEKRLKKKKQLRVNAWVVPRGKQAWRIDRVEELEE